MPVRSIAGSTPRIGARVYVAPDAQVIGDVTLCEGASVWFGTVLRGDVGRIRVGKRTNIQDLSCAHVTGGIATRRSFDTTVGDDVTTGHKVILHGCTIEDGCLIGMGAIVMDGAVVGEGSLIGAGAVVTPGTIIPPRSLVLGMPARVIRQVDEREGRLGIEGATHYLELAASYAELDGYAEQTWFED